MSTVQELKQLADECTANARSAARAGAADSDAALAAKNWAGAALAALQAQMTAVRGPGR